MLDERGGVTPFGWAVTCVGRRPDQVGDDVRALVEWSAREWKRHFPAERGFQICVESPAGTAHGVHMRAQRGDFEAEATIERAQRGSSRSSAVRAFGRARSVTLQRAHGWGERVIGRGRVAGWAFGVGLFLTLAWLMIGVNDPIYVLGGMLLVVAMLLMLLAGGTLGGWFGERIAKSVRGRLRSRVLANPALHDDLRRFRAISRKLLAQRATFGGQRGQPFRRTDERVAS